jgi:hypothetical protein
MLVRKSLLLPLAALMALAGQAFGWGPDGHHTVGAIADRLIAGSNAALQVEAILGDMGLQDASVWADCAKGVDPRDGYAYHSDPLKYPECMAVEIHGGKAAMIEFVRRNDRNCSEGSDKISCHTLYHFTDVPIQRDSYVSGYVGTRDVDIVHATVAALHVLKGDPTPAPFKFRDKREALLLLAHYVGDIHQPLHVGAVYLDRKGKLVDPDRGGQVERMDTQGGNLTWIDGDENRRLHAAWDATPDSLKVSQENIERLLKKAKAIPHTKGPLFDWPTTWASDTLMEAKKAFADVRFSGNVDGHWDATLPAGYAARMERIKETQLVKAGARLAQALQTIWP